uniref:Glycosyltransferase 2-like domain-containing protein n=1 Tax=Rubrivivax gelatinosus S1 TaxID=1138313 RepID=L8BAF6_RUBGE|nr:hypothetical protein RGS1_70340 [Rubrivivax gelatinosus S1]
MTTLAERFDTCLAAIESGDMALARSTLAQLQRASLPPAAARLYDHLRTRSAEDAAEPCATGPATRLSAMDGGAPVPGVSIVAACMNRQTNLLKVLPSWLASDVDEIIIVDWSSTEPVWPMLSGFDDPRLKVVRIDDEPRWILTHALNVGLRLARHEIVFKLDADIALAPDFLVANRFGPTEFVRGFWKTAVDAGESDQRYVNGSFGARKADLRQIRYYNERIQTYGWDDSDLYARLSGSLGRAGRLLAHGSLRHIEQSEAQRLENQAVAPHLALGRFAATEHENLVNRYHELANLEWPASFELQDYEIVPFGTRLLRGRRLTTSPALHASERRMAATLAMRQLAVWQQDSFPPGIRDLTHELGFARLLRQAHAAGQSAALADALRQRRGIHLFRPAAGFSAATVRTVRLLLDSHPVLAGSLLIVADEVGPLGDGPGDAQGVLSAPAEIVDRIATATGARARADLDRLEATLLEGEPEHCIVWDVSPRALIVSAIAHADRIASSLAPRFRATRSQVPSTALATSIYDETNLVRLLEYLACVVLNLRCFEHLLLMYEARSGLMQMLLQALCRMSGVSPYALVLVPFDRRPTFEELFALQRLVPANSLLAVANADVAFDASLADLAAAADDRHVHVLSRWDIDADGRNARLIRLECGAPNTFSADAWIVRTPFAPDFRLDYPIGTFHCDSFINHQLSRSGRYRWANPCLDVHVFHLHDTRFNSSAEKNVRDRAEIARRYSEERERNGGEDPLKGAPWSHLAQVPFLDDPAFLIRWHPKSLVLDTTARGFDLSTLVWLPLLLDMTSFDDGLLIYVRLRGNDSAGPAGRLLARLKQRCRASRLVMETDDDAGVTRSQDPAAVHRNADARGWLRTLGDSGLEALRAQVCELTAWPTQPNVGLLRCEVDLGLDDHETGALLSQVARLAPEGLRELTEWFGTLDAWSPERLLLQPVVDELSPQEGPARAPAAVRAAPPRVAFVTSLFRGGDFLQGYLENVIEAAAIADGEVILVDANCDDTDAPVIERVLGQVPASRRERVRWMRLSQDPGLYACWRLAIEATEAPYVTNANLDDRRSPLHTARLVAALDARPHLAAACGSISAVRQGGRGGWYELPPNELWFHEMGPRELGFDDLYLRDGDGTIRSRNVLHCMPVWRRRLHADHGFFDEERYGTSADWAFWLRCAKAGERYWFEPRAFGRYYINPESHNRRNDADGAKERKIILDLLGTAQDVVVKQ